MNTIALSVYPLPCLDSMLRSSPWTITRRLPQFRFVPRAYSSKHSHAPEESGPTITLGPPRHSALPVLEERSWNSDTPLEKPPAPGQQVATPSAPAEELLPKVHSSQTDDAFAAGESHPHQEQEVGTTPPPSDLDRTWSLHPGNPASTSGDSLHPSETNSTPADKSSFKDAYAVQFDEAKARLFAWSALTHTRFRRNADVLSSRASARFSELGGKLNHVTGYHEIELLKKRVVEQGMRIPGRLRRTVTTVFSSLRRGAYRENAR